MINKNKIKYFIKIKIKSNNLVKIAKILIKRFRNMINIQNQQIIMKNNLITVSVKQIREE
jgi:hypothetical protein